MSCCDWITFELGLTRLWWDKFGDHGEFLLDLDAAEKMWRRYHCTAREAFDALKAQLSADNPYTFHFGPPKGRGGGDDGSGPEKPKAPMRPRERA